jgi:hypothetical protein
VYFSEGGCLYSVNLNVSFAFLYTFCFLVELGFELRASHLQRRYSTVFATPPVDFALVILEVGSCELSALACLEPQCSRFQPLK